MLYESLVLDISQQIILIYFLFRLFCVEGLLNFLVVALISHFDFDLRFFPSLGDLAFIYLGLFKNDVHLS